MDIFAGFHCHLLILLAIIKHGETVVKEESKLHFVAALKFLTAIIF